MIPITLAPWKIPFSVTGSLPYAVKVRLADMLFDTTVSPWIPRSISQVGTYLPHDIILYDPALYLDGGIIDPSAARESRQSRGIYLTKVAYDARANAIWHEDPAYKVDTARSVLLGTPQYGYYEYLTDAALAPVELDYSLSSGRTYLSSGILGSNLTDRLDPTNLSTDDVDNPRMIYQSSCTVGIAGTTTADISFIVLSSTDRALQATIPGSALIPFTKIYFQSDTSGLPEVVDILRFFTGYGIDLDGVPKIDPDSGDSYSVLKLIDPTFNTALTTTEIWIRCSFFADYIIPESFNQDLTTTSQVSHKNLVVGTGDFSRFNRESPLLETSPYLPQTPPRNDILNTNINDSGNLPIPPRIGTYDATGSLTRIPIGWYDPDFVDTSNTYPANSLRKDILTALPKEGNVYTSGRIFSPTIDELWIYIKKLVNGRDNDITAAALPGPRSITAALAITADTRIPREPELVLPSTKLGDPISTDGTLFVNKPEGFKYAINANIKYLADKALTPGIDTDAYAPFSSHSSNSGFTLASRLRVDSAALQTTGDWGPREIPMSLRELEAGLMNQQFNFEVLFNFMIANKVSTGNTDTDDTNPQGTLYQLHRNYNPNLDILEPNSKWLTAINTKTIIETAATYGTHLPGGADYAYQSSIAQEDVYLSAEGYWRYLFDHVRIPILTETY